MRSRSRPILLFFCFFILLSPGIFAQSRESASALRLYQSAKYDDAIAAGARLVKAAPKSVDGYLIVCWSYLKLEKWDQAMNWAKQASLVQRYDYRVVEIMGQAAFNLGKNEEALRHYQEYVTYIPEGSSLGTTYAIIGEIYIRLGQYAHADIALTTAANFLPSDASIRARQAYAREQAGDYLYAEEAYRSALKLNPALVDAKLGLERVNQKLRN
jgi:tetratricopeptide (TPR) repeat protein